MINNNGSNRKVVNFTYSCLYARPVQVDKLLSNSLANFNLGNVNLLSNPNMKPKIRVAYKKTCSKLQILEVLQNAVILIYHCEIYP